MTKIGMKEFIALMACLMALPAMTTDTILPALPILKDYLHVQDEKNIQFVISILFFGMIFGQLIFGPLSESFGRKRGITIGLIVCMFGSLVSIFSTNLTLMLLGRFLQGVGAASARVVCVAMIRDMYQGREMARMMSFIMTVFIFVPVVAPTVGQGILHIAPWQMIFGLFILNAGLCALWMNKRLNETLTKEHQKVFSVPSILKNFKIVLRNKITLTYSICTGVLFAAFIGYLTIVQSIFQDFYHAGENFSIYFGLSALSLGFASLTNGLIVRRFGMRRICTWAFCSIIVLAGSCLLLFDLTKAESIPIPVYMAFVMPIFFFNGLLFGNINALAMEPMGDHAGTASAVISSISNLVAILCGSIIGQNFDGTLTPLFIGFLSFAVIGLVLHLFATLKLNAKSLPSSALLSAVDAYKWIKKNPHIKILDATYPPNPQGSAIPNAIVFDIDDIADPQNPLPHSLPSAHLFAQKMQQLGIENQDDLFIYDSSGIYMAASRAWWMMRVFGHDQVRIIDGGLPAWIAANLPIGQHQLPTPTTEIFETDFREYLVVSKDEMKHIVESQSAVILDARPEDRFCGIAPEPRANMRSGHMPHAINVPTLTLIDPSTGCLNATAPLPPFESGSPPRIVTTCGSGVTACVIALALFERGQKDAAVYDGSWAEWGQTDSDTPIVN